MPTLPPVGRCIYCGRDAAQAGALTKEHVIAEALNGDLILPEASCADCQQLICKFEQVVARPMYGALRHRRGFRSKRSRAKRRADLPATYYLPDGTAAPEAIPIDDYPGHYLAAELPPPGILIGRPPSPLNPEFKLQVRGVTGEIDPLLRPDQLLGLTLKFDWNAFNRVVAKIAHAFLVSAVGFEGYTPLLTGIILGTDPCFSYLIGGSDAEPSCELQLFLHQREPNDLISVQVALMGLGRCPTYLAVAGEVTERQLIRRKISDKQVS